MFYTVYFGNLPKPQGSMKSMDFNPWGFQNLNGRSV